jgi:hypothetical protein
MNALVTILILACISVPKDSDYPLVAVMGINRGEYPGSYVTELKINRTVYVSLDYCRKAEVAWNASYPARMSKQTIWVLVGSQSCKYHVIDEHPYLAHRTAENTVENKE